MPLDSDEVTGASVLLSERIRKALADDIASGAIAEGSALDEQQIGARFNASRTPAREALRLLAADGLVEMRPRRGAVVTSLSLERIGEMLEMSAEMEALCARLATHRMNPFERATLQRLHAESEAHIGEGKVDDYRSFNLEFHELIYSGTKNEFIVEQALALRSRMASFFRRTQLDAGRSDLVRAEHANILDAMMKGQGEEAARLMRAHIFNTAGALEQHVAARKTAKE